MTVVLVMVMVMLRCSDFSLLSFSLLHCLSVYLHTGSHKSSLPIEDAPRTAPLFPRVCDFDLIGESIPNHNDVLPRFMKRTYKGDEMN